MEFPRRNGSHAELHVALSPGHRGPSRPAGVGWSRGRPALPAGRGPDGFSRGDRRSGGQSRQRTRLLSSRSLELGRGGGPRGPIGRPPRHDQRRGRKPMGLRNLWPRAVGTAVALDRPPRHEQGADGGVDAGPAHAVVLVGRRRDAFVRELVDGPTEQLGPAGRWHRHAVLDLPPRRPALGRRRQQPRFHPGRRRSGAAASESRRCLGSGTDRGVGAAGDDDGRHGHRCRHRVRRGVEAGRRRGGMAGVGAATAVGPRAGGADRGGRGPRGGAMARCGRGATTPRDKPRSRPGWRTSWRSPRALRIRWRSMPRGS